MIANIMRKTGRKNPKVTPMMKSCMNAERVKTINPASALGRYCNEERNGREKEGEKF